MFGTFPKAIFCANKRFVAALLAPLFFTFSAPENACAFRSISPSETTTTADIEKRLRHAPKKTAGLEEWGANVWDRLYDLGREGAVTRDALSNALDASQPVVGTAPSCKERWQDVVRLATQMEPDRQAAAQAFMNKEAFPAELNNATLLYDRQNQRSLLIVGDERRFQLTVALAGGAPTGWVSGMYDAQANSARWQVLAPRGTAGFTSDGRMVAGLNPLEKPQLGLVPFDPPYTTHRVENKQMSLETTARFLPVDRIVWLVSSTEKDLSDEALLRVLFGPEYQNLSLPGNLLQAAAAVPRETVRVPTHMPVEKYRQSVVPQIAGQEEPTAVFARLEERVDGLQSMSVTAMGTPVVVISRGVAEKFPGLQILGSLWDRSVVIDRGDPADTLTRAAERGDSIHFYGSGEETSFFSALAARARMPFVSHDPAEKNFLFLVKEILENLGVPGEIIDANIEAITNDLRQLALAA